MKQKRAPQGLGKTLMLMMGGACIGGAAMFAFSMFQSIGGDEPSNQFDDPPAPHLHKQFPHLADELLEITQLAGLVPEKNREEFKTTMQSCIRSVEKIARVKRDLEKADDRKALMDDVRACASRIDHVSDLLTEANKLFAGGGASVVKDRIDVFQTLLVGAVLEMNQDCTDC